MGYMAYHRGRGEMLAQRAIRSSALSTQHSAPAVDTYNDRNQAPIYEVAHDDPEAAATHTFLRRHIYIQIVLAALPHHDHDLMHASEVSPRIAQAELSEDLIPIWHYRRSRTPQQGSEFALRRSR